MKKEARDKVRMQPLQKEGKVGRKEPMCSQRNSKGNRRMKVRKQSIAQRSIKERERRVVRRVITRGRSLNTEAVMILFLKMWIKIRKISIFRIVS